MAGRYNQSYRNKQKVREGPISVIQIDGLVSINRNEKRTLVITNWEMKTKLIIFIYTANRSFCESSNMHKKRFSRKPKCKAFCWAW